MHSQILSLLSLISFAFGSEVLVVRESVVNANQTTHAVDGPFPTPPPGSGTTFTLERSGCELDIVRTKITWSLDNKTTCYVSIAEETATFTVDVLGSPSLVVVQTPVGRETATATVSDMTLLSGLSTGDVNLQGKRRQSTNVIDFNTQSALTPKITTIPTNEQSHTTWQSASQSAELLALRAFGGPNVISLKSTTIDLLAGLSFPITIPLPLSAVIPFESLKGPLPTIPDVVATDIPHSTGPRASNTDVLIPTATSTTMDTTPQSTSPGLTSHDDSQKSKATIPMTTAQTQKISQISSTGGTMHVSDHETNALTSRTASTRGQATNPISTGSASALNASPSSHALKDESGTMTTKPNADTTTFPGSKTLPTTRNTGSMPLKGSEEPFSTSGLDPLTSVARISTGSMKESPSRTTSADLDMASLRRTSKTLEPSRTAARNGMLTETPTTGTHKLSSGLPDLLKPSTAKPVRVSEPGSTTRIAQTLESLLRPISPTSRGGAQKTDVPIPTSSKFVTTDLANIISSLIDVTATSPLSDANLDDAAPTSTFLGDGDDNLESAIPTNTLAGIENSDVADPSSTLTGNADTEGADPTSIPTSSASGGAIEPTNTNDSYVIYLSSFVASLASQMVVPTSSVSIDVSDISIWTVGGAQPTA